MLWVTALALLTAQLCGAAPLTVEQEGQWRAQIRANFFIPEPLPAPEAITHRRFHPAPGVAAEAVSYATQFGMRVPAILYLPDPFPAGKRIPGFIVVNGHGGDKYSECVQPGRVGTDEVKIDYRGLGAGRGRRGRILIRDEPVFSSSRQDAGCSGLKARAPQFRTSSPYPK